MLLFQSLKSLRKKHESENPNSNVTKAELRLRTDLKELTIDRWSARGTVTRINFPGKTHRRHSLNFTCTVCPQQGPYAGGSFCFKLQVPENYPFQPPSVQCLDKVYHPNLDGQTGEVSLAILDRDWKPVLSMNTVIFALQLLFLEPNYKPERVKNREAALLCQNNPQLFHQRVQSLIQSQRSNAVGSYGNTSNKRQYTHRPNSPELRGVKRHRSAGPDALDTGLGRLSLSPPGTNSGTTSPRTEMPLVPPPARVQSSSPTSNGLLQVPAVGKKRSRMELGDSDDIDMDEPEPTRRRIDDPNAPHVSNRMGGNFGPPPGSLVGSSSPVSRVVDDWNLTLRNTIHEGPVPLQPWRQMRSHSAPNQTAQPNRPTRPGGSPTGNNGVG